MANISLPTPLDAQWYGSNYNQMLLALFYGASGSNSNLDTRGFRYHNLSGNDEDFSLDFRFDL